MDTYIVYFDETGDDGVTTVSSNSFILTGIYMSTDSWQNNFDAVRACRKFLKEEYGFHISEELHTKHLLTDKEPYRKYGWTVEQRQEIIKTITIMISKLDIKIVNVIIDKTHFKDGNYKVLENALKYNIQRIENDSRGEWNYIIITDKGRLAPMRNTARAIRAYNPIPSKYYSTTKNQPVKYLIEDILEKDSKESYFIQICDFVSYMVHLYYKTHEKGDTLPTRVERVIDKVFLGQVMATLKEGDVLNLNANLSHKFGFVIYPK